MLLSSCFSLPFGLIVLYSWRPTAAATLAPTPVKRGRLIDPIDCPGPLPSIHAEYPRNFDDLNHLCTSKAGHPHNLGCICLGELLICGLSHWPRVVRLISYCRRMCGCPDPGHKDISPDRQYTHELTDWDAISEGRYADTELEGSQSDTGINGAAGGGLATTGGTTLATTGGKTSHSCTKKCTSVNRDCDWFFTGDCKCYAPPVSLFFWFSGSCGPVHHLPKRELAQQRHSFLVNATSSLPHPNSRTALPAHDPPGLAVQLTSGLLPSPCNANYVSFGCVDAPDGIIHEPQKNWLGAVLPADAKTFPPVPERFLSIHGIKESSTGGQISEAIVN